jgi:hypothetical protein
MTLPLTVFSFARTGPLPKDSGELFPSFNSSGIGKSKVELREQSTRIHRIVAGVKLQGGDSILGTGILSEPIWGE